MNEQDFAELSAGYALDALSPEERSVFESTLAEHPEWSGHIEVDAAAASALAETVVEVAPPLTLRSALLSRIAATPQGVDAAVQTAPAAQGDADAPAAPAAPPADAPPTTTTMPAVARRNWTRSLLALAASLVLLVTLGFGAASVWQMVNRSPAVVALEQIDAAPDAQVADTVLDDGGTAVAHWSDSVGKVVLVSEGLPSIASDQTFEMWFVRADGTPVSAGTFEASGDGPTTTLLNGEVEAGDTIAVTVEPAGGSPTDAPTTDPIVAIPTA